MSKKALLATGVLDFISWILWVVVLILMYFVIKFTAGGPIIAISSDISRDNYFSSIHLLNTPYKDSISVSEALINVNNDDYTKDQLVDFILARYPLKYDKDISISNTYIGLCLNEEKPPKLLKCSFINNGIGSKTYNDVEFYLPNKLKKTYVTFIYKTEINLDAFRYYTPMVS
jgi:hypothetical protein